MPPCPWCDKPKESLESMASHARRCQWEYQPATEREQAARGLLPMRERKRLNRVDGSAA